jgi:NADPH-dependent curcumin reductase CurA
VDWLVISQIVLILQISEYSALKKATTGPRIFSHILFKRLTIQGFLTPDHDHRIDELLGNLQKLIADGKIKNVQTVREGFEKLPELLVEVYKGQNVGKMVAKV